MFVVPPNYSTEKLQFTENPDLSWPFPHPKIWNKHVSFTRAFVTFRFTRSSNFDTSWSSTSLIWRYHRYFPVENPLSLWRPPRNKRWLQNLYLQISTTHLISAVFWQKCLSFWVFWSNFGFWVKKYPWGPLNTFANFPKPPFWNPLKCKIWSFFWEKCLSNIMENGCSLSQKWCHFGNWNGGIVFYVQNWHRDCKLVIVGLLAWKKTIYCTKVLTCHYEAL